MRAIPAPLSTRILALTGGVLFSAVLLARANSSVPTYSLGSPLAPVIRNTPSETDNAWLLKNPAMPMSSEFYSAPNFENAPVSAIGTASGLPRYCLMQEQSGSMVEAIKPQYYLGDVLIPPDNVDWESTYAHWQSDKTEQKSFLFDNVGARVFVIQGGTAEFTWVLKNGTSSKVTYILSTVCSNRPYRLYWTEPPYNGPAINLSGKFVKMFGREDLTEIERGTVTNYAGGIMQIITNNIVSGLFVDPSTSLLRAYGNLQGQLVLVYYDSGMYETIKHVQVVEVGPPYVNELKGEIGRALKPSGAGYSVQGLQAMPQSVHLADNRGDFFYQHKGRHSYSPKNGEVYPLRDTRDAPWRLPVYWMEEDAFGTLWPFELCHYACEWPKDPQPLIAGARVPIPDNYTVELMSFQEPEGHALAPEGNVFSTVSEGYSLLRLMGDDDVWFIPIVSVARSDGRFFDLSKHFPWQVGKEIIPFNRLHSSHRKNYRPEIDVDFPGHINLEVSDSNYNPRLYRDPFANVGVPSVSPDNPASVADTNSFSSVIYGVSASSRPLEVWWSGKVLQASMPAAIHFPCAIDRYQIDWPALNAIPQIVLASGQGSDAKCVREDGGAAVFLGRHASLRISDRAFFSKDGGGVAFWVKSPANGHVEEGSVLTIGAFSGPQLFVDKKKGSHDRACTFEAVFREASAAATPVKVTTGDVPCDGNWHKLAFVYDYDHPCSSDPTGVKPALVSLIDGKISKCEYLDHRLDCSGASGGNTIGASSIAGRESAPLLSIDDILFRNFPSTKTDRMEIFYERMTAAVPGATAFISFDEGAELANLEDGAAYKISDAVQGTSALSTNIFIRWPGAPRFEQALLVSDSPPVIYRQNDRSLPGYNPNEEHAFVRQSGGAYNIWALRCDLNEVSGSREEDGRQIFEYRTSAPIVLVEYEKNGRKAMRPYSVVATSDLYPELGGDMVVGTVLPGPHPLDMMDDPWLPEDAWDYAGCWSIYRDRKKQLWCRAPGEFQVYMYYANQEGFDYPSLEKNPDAGVPVPWLGYYIDSVKPDANVLKRTPAPWTWRASWPKNVPTMRIGQTLTKASGGLPEVWNAKSLSVVYPDSSMTNEVRETALLYDPTVARHYGSTAFGSKPSDLVKALGWEVGPGGDVSLRGGKYWFHKLPPSISSRFYIDSNRSVTECLTFEGSLDEKTGGASMLYPNVATESERTAIKGLVSTNNCSATLKETWDELISTLAFGPSIPSVLSWSGTVPDPPEGKTTSLPGREISTSYGPRDHYALTAMGRPGYVVLIENDATNSLLGVKSGDPISMHVFTVTNDYYTGRVVTREDEKNLLSEQLSVLYTEAFAGQAEDYVFEWKKAEPSVDGIVPDDYDRLYKRVFSLDDSLGLTRFVIGKQGDSLCDMVNSYYACRYRAASTNSPAYDSMKFAWSDWCGPALAEGWVQRVLNNMTPFSQRMRDLYVNPSENAVSMIKQAGAPYEGDVALTQDNMKDIGLIQLYQTILNKAESLSLSLGVNDSNANKQLQLATGRLGDLYMVLGNEALSDALNPTIGFGSDYDGAATGLHSIDYGSAFSSLFCFDNQVPTLLDEELALLRGRSGENAPSVHMPPYYNRLVWNFTKGIHAGEVAYAVNYDINSANGDAVLDEEDAAKQFPQGHGDAYGYYLAALNGYYRLLRNPYFSWGPPSMGEMVVNDAVVNVDYYDEARFAEIADKLAETAALVTDRTARKAWRDNNGAVGAGYRDRDPSRAFGYGEWATRGAIGAVMNWMVGNSLLPAAANATTAQVLSLAQDSLAFMERTPLDSVRTPNWTFEMQVSGVSVSATNGAPLFSWIFGTNVVSVVVNTDRTADLCKVSLDERQSYDPAFEEVGGSGDESAPDPEGNEAFILVTNLLDRIPLGVLPEHALIALSHSEGKDVPPVLRIFDVEKNVSVAQESLTSVMNLEKFSDGYPMLGGRCKMRPFEMRFWNRTFDDATLLSIAPMVSARTDGLLAYSRGISDQGAVGELPDEVSGENAWFIVNPIWTSSTKKGVNVSFTDKGLLRIDRSTSPSLDSLPEHVGAIQATLNKLDGGFNPIGLSQHAIPFDITPIGAGDEGKTHFEQIASRARIALRRAANVLDEVETLSSRLRMIENAAVAEESIAGGDEGSYREKLIGLYGYPYADDIGPSGTYVQGYDGPDLLHFMWMDLAPYGITDVEDQEVTLYTYKPPVWSSGLSLSKYLVNYTTKDKEFALQWSLSANGLVMKPEEIRGTRRATGRIQKAYAEFLIAYGELSAALDWYERKDFVLGTESATSEASLLFEQAKLATLGTFAGKAFTIGKAALAAKLSLNAVESSLHFLESSRNTAVLMSPKIVGAGMTVNQDPSALVAASLVPTYNSSMLPSLTAKNSLQDSILRMESGGLGNLITTTLMNAGNFFAAATRIRDRLTGAIDAQWNAAMNVKRCMARLVTTYENVNSLIAEGERLQMMRSKVRAKSVNRLTKLRYNDMYFRQLRSEALQRYDSAFELAQRYVYLASQAYDYETAQLSSEHSAGEAFRAEIVGARSIGRIGDDGEPMLASSLGEGGLSDILARMEANWLVLKPRLGINNPEKNATWFSLRRELFRIDPEFGGDANWREEMARYWVDDLRALPSYRRFCQPFSSDAGPGDKEPGFVIPFSTDIEFGMNFFGKTLQQGDSAYDSTYYSTKIAGAGIRFVGYNEKVNGYSGKAVALSATPAVYLVPLGADRMRVPGAGEKADVLDYNVVDQVVPVPYKVGSGALDDPDWQSVHDGYSGGVDMAARIRRYPSFRAITGEASDGGLSSTRLVGRSAWNTRWELIIPAGAMLGGTAEDREAVRDLFLFGKDVDRDGRADISGVRDIELGLRTYSNSGN